MARVAILGAALQDLYLIDRDDLTPLEIGDTAIYGKIAVGSKVDIDRIKYDVGGGGLNVAISLSRFGHDTILLSNIGEDVAGDAIMRKLDAEAIDNSYMNYVAGQATGTSVVMLDSKGGERTIFTCRGASGRFDNISPADLDLAQPDWLYVTTLNGDLVTLEKFFNKAWSLGTKIMFNPGAKELAEPKKLLKLLGKVSVLLVNKSEAAKLVPGNMLAELLYHLNGYAPITIITDGQMGGIAGNYETRDSYRFGIYEDVKVKDATGAGDAFGAGFLAAYASGKSFRQALVYAAANSTAVVRKIGANAGALDSLVDLHPMPIQKI